MGYCEPEDLLIGDIGGLDNMKVTFIDAATEEIDSFLGYVYELPLVNLSTHGELIVKGICRKLASGRLIMAQATGQEDDASHAYGLYLVEQAMNDLWSIRNGQTELGADKPDNLSVYGDGPAIIQGDSTSGVDAFYAWATQPWLDPVLLGPIWTPGIHE